VSREHPRLADLPPGARVGTSSPRRQALLRNLRPDLALELVRGNVDTRLKRLDEGTLDAILLACAGLERLGLGTRISEILDADRFVPAVGQGVIGIECRADDTAIRAAVAVLDDPPTAQRLAAERACAQRLHGSCHSPIAAYAALDDGQLLVRGFVGSPDGREAYRDSVRGPSDEAAELGVALAERLLQAGADDLLERLRASAATAP
jgi:hydroxymethylbilane synthase